MKRLCKLGIHAWKASTEPARVYQDWCQYAIVCRHCQKEDRKWVKEH